MKTMWSSRKIMVDRSPQKNHQTYSCQHLHQTSCVNLSTKLSVDFRLVKRSREPAIDPREVFRKDGAREA
ncbi:hypothetical protein CDAR_246111 [Caerostris darwini]|uniref:Uncharacterized protein n=1 Tax=Caerostris darwini TaxID=1538125 RepID=A0AAV4QSJ9_9ARAC|nr:hypothetical protein CDAR_246111 [Caerostris darwini]